MGMGAEALALGGNSDGKPEEEEEEAAGRGTKMHVVVRAPENTCRQAL